jgi:hypothetical protein
MELAQAIRAQMLGKETLSWQEDGRESSAPFTRGMLIDFLATAVPGKRDRNVQTTVDLPIGELWWERVR